MKRQHYAWYSIALGILVVGLALAGVPWSILLLGLIVLACPMMMVFMMGGHGHGCSSGTDAGETHDQSQVRPAQVDRPGDLP